MTRGITCLIVLSLVSIFCQAEESQSPQANIGMLVGNLDVASKGGQTLVGGISSDIVQWNDFSFGWELWAGNFTLSTNNTVAHQALNLNLSWNFWNYFSIRAKIGRAVQTPKTNTNILTGSFSTSGYSLSYDYPISKNWSLGGEAVSYSVGNTPSQVWTGALLVVKRLIY